jgi:hypothetical protein
MTLGLGKAVVKKRDFAVNAGLVLISVVFAVLAMEAGMRLFMEAPLYARYTADEKQANIDSEGLPDPGFYEYTPTGIRLRVNASGHIRNHLLVGGSVPLRTNKYGFRGPDIVSDDRKRALFLGDSITIADYLLEEQTFVHLVGEMSSSGKHPLQTINAAIGSIGIEEQYSILHETGHLVKPDIVVLNLYLNDWHASPAMQLIPVPKVLRWSRAAQLYYQKKSVEQFEARAGGAGGWIPEEVQAGWKQATALEFPPAAEAGDWARDRGAYNFLMQDWFWDWGSSYSPGGRGRILFFAQKIIDLSHEIGAQLMVVIHPTVFQVGTEFDTNEPQIAFVEYFDKAGVPVLDLLQVLREHYRSHPGVSLFYDHCHHNAEGSVFVARQIYPFIMRSLDIASN